MPPESLAVLAMMAARETLLLRCVGTGCPVVPVGFATILRVLSSALGGQRPTMRISRSDGPVVARPLRWLLVRPASAGGVVAAVPPLAASAFAAADSVAAVSVAGAGVGDGSVVIKTIWFFFVSSVQVLARALVCTVCSTSKLVGLISLMMVNVPSAPELNASCVAGLNRPPSDPLPIGRLARILPSSALSTTHACGFRHMAKRMWFF